LSRRVVQPRLSECAQGPEGLDAPADGGDRARLPAAGRRREDRRPRGGGRAGDRRAARSPGPGDPAAPDRGVAGGRVDARARRRGPARRRGTSGARRRASGGRGPADRRSDGDGRTVRDDRRLPVRRDVVTETEKTVADNAQVRFETRMLIDGKLVDGSAGTFANVNPPTAEGLREVSDASTADMHRAIDAARRAFDETAWSTDGALRKQCLEQLQVAIEAELEELREELILEVGCPRMVTHGPQLDAPLAEALRYPARL